jgi:hypothetical protein
VLDSEVSKLPLFAHVSNYILADVYYYYHTHRTGKCTKILGEYHTHSQDIIMAFPLSTKGGQQRSRVGGNAGGTYIDAATRVAPQLIQAVGYFGFPDVVIIIIIIIIMF